MSSHSVSRCVAVASHGRRCQQTPYRGSPYCWHHQKSRKLPAPSRPGRSRSVPATEIAEGPGVPARPVLAPADQLVVDLGAERVDELLEFLDAEEDGSYLIERSGGRVTASVELVPRLWVRWRRATG